MSVSAHSCSLLLTQGGQHVGNVQPRLLRAGFLHPRRQPVRPHLSPSLVRLCPHVRLCPQLLVAPDGPARGERLAAPATAAGCGRCRTLGDTGGGCYLPQGERAEATPAARQSMAPQTHQRQAQLWLRALPIPAPAPASAGPVAPMGCRYTAAAPQRTGRDGDFFPCFRNPVSSTTRTPGTSPRCSSALSLGNTYGNDRNLRRWLERRDVPHVLVRSNEQLWAETDVRDGDRCGRTGWRLGWRNPAGCGAARATAPRDPGYKGPHRGWRPP